MTQQQKLLVRTSFGSLQNHTERIAGLMYAKLFELEPKSQVLFRGDIKEQGQKLMRMLHIAIDDIDQPELLQPKLYTLGMIHHSYGIESQQYVSFGEALIHALHMVLGKEFTPEIEEAWRAAYRYLAATMYNFPRKDENVQLPHH